VRWRLWERREKLTRVSPLSPLVTWGSTSAAVASAFCSFCGRIQKDSDGGTDVDSSGALEWVSRLLKLLGAIRMIQVEVQMLTAVGPWSAFAA